MLSRNQIKTIGFIPIQSPANDIRTYYRFVADGTDLILIQDLGRYEIWDGRDNGQSLWNGALQNPASLINKLIRFGNNLKDSN